MSQPQRREKEEEEEEEGKEDLLQKLGINHTMVGLEGEEEGGVGGRLLKK